MADRLELKGQEPEAVAGNSGGPGGAGAGFSCPCHCCCGLAKLSGAPGGGLGAQGSQYLSAGWGKTPALP